MRFQLTPKGLEHQTKFELAPNTLEVCCSTIKLLVHMVAGEATAAPVFQLMRLARLFFSIPAWCRRRGSNPYAVGGGF